ncbi:MAG: hypothetical protein ACKV2U_04500 [Bryobacteraceae bacterium]
MEIHVRNVGYILFYLGIGMGVISVIVLLAFGGFSGLMLTNDPFYKRNDLASIPVDRLLAAIFVTFSLVMSIPLAVCGRGILQWKPWARTLGMMVSAVNMLHVPIGTGVGIYALWVLNDEATEFLFNNVPAGGAKR